VGRGRFILAGDMRRAASLLDRFALEDRSMTTRHTLLGPLLIAAIAALPACSGASNGGEQSTTSANDLELCPLCNFPLALPDLTVVEDDRPQTVCTPQAGCYPAYAKGFDVKNLGAGLAGSFRVAVLNGSQSYGFDIPSLAAGQSEYFQLPSIPCGQSIAVLVNSTQSVQESNDANDSVVIEGYCNL
jgi:hypothetical protein